jgi:hypothetical protein
MMISKIGIIYKVACLEERFKHMNNVYSYPSRLKNKRNCDSEDLKMKKWFR